MQTDGVPGAPAPRAAPAGSVVVERPPPGLQRGREPGPTWLIALFGAMALLVLGLFYARKLAAKRRP